MQKEYNYFEECFKDCRSLLKALSDVATDRGFYLTLTYDPSTEEENAVSVIIKDPEEFKESDEISGLTCSYYFLLGALLGSRGTFDYQKWQINKYFEDNNLTIEKGKIIELKDEVAEQEKK